LVVEAAIITIERTLVFSDAITIERNNVEIIEEMTSKIAMIIRLKSILKDVKIQLWAINITSVHANMPADTMSREARTNICTSSICCAEKLCPKNRCTPLGIPSVPIAMKIEARETMVEEVPIISGLVIFDMINQKK
jgi:hypothetical protein